MSKKRILPGLALMGVVAAGTVLCGGPAAADASAPARKLVVGIKPAAPFVLRRPDGTWGGMSVDLWREVAARLHAGYEMRESDLDGLLRGVESGSFDVAVAALSVTAGRAKQVDFTHPFYTTGLGIAVRATGNDGWLAIGRRLFSRPFLTTLGALVLILLLCGVLVWWFERRRNPEQFGGRPATGVASGFWWAAVTMTTVGYGDKAPKTAGGRVVALVWMFTSVAIISTFTAGIASALTVGRLQSPIQGPADLDRGRVGTAAGTTSAAYLDSRKIPYTGYDRVEKALEALRAGDLDAVVYDAPILIYLIRQAPAAGERIAVLPGTFEQQNYAFAVHLGSDLRKQIDIALLEVLESPRWKEIQSDYLGR